jgi:uncharacterized low-complexity protein
MSSNTRNKTTLVLGAAAAALALAGSGFAMESLSEGYGVPAQHADAEGKCGEGTCGDARFAKADTTRDALVSKAEFIAAVGKVPGVDALFAKKDRDGDGYISEREAYENVKEAFNANGRQLPSGLFAGVPEAK